ncbi:hypothetical protein FACS18942_09890 [Planctomycetales bacterium]|nr:hypothetical protein FACS18942_09890 [Planctomycetales bacterium]
MTIQELEENIDRLERELAQTNVSVISVGVDGMSVSYDNSVKLKLLEYYKRELKAKLGGCFKTCNISRAF